MIIKLIVAWLFVGLALGWGVVQSIHQSKPLFSGAKVEAKP